MNYMLLKLLHVIGAVIMGAGLIGVWLADLRGRQVEDLPRFSEAVRNIRVFYDGLVFPGAILLLVSGTWMVVTTYGGWRFHFLKIPWLAGMAILFAFEFIEGNTVTRLYFVRLGRLTREALRQGRFTEALVAARDSTTTNFTHFLDIPLYLVIVALGTTKPMTWTLFFASSAVAVAVAVALTLVVPRLFRWSP
jgi:hypothetical protein